MIHNWIITSTLILAHLLALPAIDNPDPLPGEKKTVEVLHRWVSIDNVCAWPNLTRLEDGSIHASIFNQPSHARMEGSVEVWSTTDGGHFWEKSGVAAAHDPGTNRMNVAAGKNGSGELVVVASGWELKPGESEDARMDLVGVLRAWTSISKDGGEKWKTYKNGFPGAEEGMTEFIPFGDVLEAMDGSLRVLAYAQSLDKAVNKVSMFRSDDQGKNWRWVSHLSDASGHTAFAGGHNETAFYQTGPETWIAAARRWKAGAAMDLFTSEDDGASWQYLRQLTEESQHPGHITSLKNGELLLTYGNRIPGEYGVAVKFSSDQGKTWSNEFLVVDDLKSRDCGYPSSVQLPDGSIMTAYYSNGNSVHDRYHMGTVIWKKP
ncbi:sialidase family protein [Cyclobacterium plantarum]|uniref:Exo-alpha-sialidase n=1 Tax=Cyclobacterium plantarum TaxID=2716263 RepID=A0ABX0HAU3_9BACT|nr:sialidase family protein [Cyclobacterium plantarum]NHE58888.1 exo-alpha-sialidase [Cyclobacterium plantarum]